MATAKSNVRNAWRTCKSVSDFLQVAKLSPECLPYMNVTLGVFEDGSNLQKSIQYWALIYLKSIKAHLMMENELGGINWMRLPPETELQWDELIEVYVELLRISLVPQRPETYEDIKQRLCELLPANTPHMLIQTGLDDADFYTRAAADAFHKGEMGNRDVTVNIYQQIRDYYQSYNSQNYLAPYTSLIGPSGIGKSFAVQQMARKNMVYVSYTNFGRQSSSGYPRRSVIAGMIPIGSNTGEEIRNIITIFFECLIASTLVQVGVCKELGITPRGYYEMQTRPELRWVQKEFAMLVYSLYHLAEPAGALLREKSDRSSYHQSSEDIEKEGSDYQGYMQAYLPTHRGQAREVFRNIVDQLKPEGSYKPYFAPSGIPPDNVEQEPSVILCFDEAGELLVSYNNEQPDAEFLALRRALRHQASITRRHQARRFFGLILDTSSTINTSSALTSQGKNARATVPRALFPPIYQIDTWDLYARETEDAVAHTIPDPRRLFELGRPLWGSLMEAMRSIDTVVDIAEMKSAAGVSENKPKDPLNMERALAMLSYRINFYVVHTELAERLASGYLRVTYEVNDSRTLLRTIQPSEPIMAHVASKNMKLFPARRLDAVKALYQNAMGGFVGIGDSGKFVAALVLLFAIDAASTVFEMKAAASLPSPVKLSSFLSHLFREETVSAMKSRVIDSTSLAKLWKYGELFFNHFTRAETQITEDTLRKAFRRGTAILAPFNHIGCDIVIPVYVPIDNRMTYVAVEVKNRQEDTLTSNIKLEGLTKLKNATSGLPKTESHIGLFMCLRGKADKGVPLEKSVSQESEVIYPPERQKRYVARHVRNDYKWDDMMRIVVATVGLNCNVFPGLRLGDEAVTEEMLQYMRRLLLCHHDSVLKPTSYQKRFSVLQ